MNPKPNETPGRIPVKSETKNSLQEALRRQRELEDCIPIPAANLRRTLLALGAVDEEIDELVNDLCNYSSRDSAGNAIELLALKRLNEFSDAQTKLRDATQPLRGEALSQERGKRYGPPHIGHAALGLAWTGLLMDHYQDPLLAPLPAFMVELMMAQVKLQRAAKPFVHNPDDYADVERYLTFAEADSEIFFEAKEAKDEPAAD